MFLTRIAFTVRRLTGAFSSERRLGLCSADEFGRVLTRERARSNRNGELFSLLTFSPSEERTAAKTQRHLARILRQRLRATDEVGWLDEQRIGVLLPATPPEGAWTVAEAVCGRLPSHLPRPQCAVYCYPWPRMTDVDMPQRNGNGKAGGRRRRDQREELEGVESHAEATVVEAALEPTVTNLNGSARSLEPLMAHGLPWWKRGLDVIVASVSLALLSPLMAVVAAVIKATSPGPVFFCQQRSGLGGKPFVMFKFRTMTRDAETQKVELQAMNEQDGPAFKMKSDPRVTPFGRFLRTTSIDEFPQLWNVLRGDMTLVGPRPLPCDETDACEEWQRRRLDVTPGVTCIWQVKGRSAVAFDDWIRMDLQYVRTRSPIQDAKLLVQTVPAVLSRRGAS